MVNQYGQWIADYPGQLPTQDPIYMRMAGQQMPQQHAPQQPQENPRTVEVLPADNERFVLDFPVGAGMTKLFAARDDSFLGVKAVSVAGEVTVDFYDKRPPAPPVPTLNPQDYVRKDELAALIAETVKERKASKKEDA